MRYSIASGVGMLAVFGAANADANGAAGHVAGLLQRISIAIGFAWIAVLAARLGRTPMVARAR